MVDREMKPITHLPRPPVPKEAQPNYLSTRTQKNLMISLKPPLPTMTRAPPSRDMSMNSLHAVALHNRKAMIEQNHNSLLASPARQLDKNEFSLKKELSNMDLITSPNLSSIPTLEKLFSTPQQSKTFVVKEAQHYVSQNQNDYYANEKVRYKPVQHSVTAKNNDLAQMKLSLGGSFATEASPIVNRNKFYQFSTPDYLRIERSDSRSKETLNSTGNKLAPPPITVISRTNGWLTVDAQTLSRKNAIEKDTKINIRNSSKLAPPWMITDQTPDLVRKAMFKPEAVITHNVSRIEPKRVILAEVNQPARSIFNFGDLRHNVSRVDDLATNFQRKPDGRVTEVVKPSRLIQWDETIPKQRFDQVKITAKIGHPVKTSIV